MSKMTRVAAVQYKIENLPDWDSYVEKARTLVKFAKEASAEIVLFAEYAGLDLILGVQGTLHNQFNMLQDHVGNYINLYKSLAHDFQIYIQPGTLPVREGSNEFRNRAYFFGPNDICDFQDKINLTPAESAVGFIKPGKELKVFETCFGKVGIAICYDSEFPSLVHSLVKAGANLILVPSCTETLSGDTRVSICSRARAIENQCYIMQSPLIGASEFCEFIEISQGKAGVYSPADLGFPQDGILSQGKMNEPGVITADLDWDKLNYVREYGQVLNFKDICKSQIMEYRVVSI